MRAITLVEPQKIETPVVTVGTFDGVHKGHAAVVEALRNEAKKKNGASVVVTFDPHPRQFIDGEKAPKLLTSLDEKKDRLAALGVDVLAVVPFDEKLRQLSPATFVETHLVGLLGAQSVIVGYDHGFGKDRQGGFDTMFELGKQFGFSVESVPPTLIEDQPVSSTRIRQAIAQADFNLVCQLFGSGYPIWGQVVKGDGRGHTLGFPTANLTFDHPAKLLPPFGVYAGRVFLPEPRLAVVNYGQRPTFAGKETAFEVHILDFNTTIYGQMLKLELCHRIRDEKAFDNRDALMVQIQRDVKTAKDWLSHSDNTILWR